MGGVYMIELEVKKGRNRFYIGDSEVNSLAQITYIPAENGKIIVDHTEVADELKGREVGRNLVDKMVEYARRENLKIIPHCSFVKKVFEENSEYQDVWIKK